MLTVADHRGKFKAVPEAKITQVNEKIATLRQGVRRLNGLNAGMMHGASDSLAIAARRRGIERSSIQEPGSDKGDFRYLRLEGNVTVANSSEDDGGFA